MFSLNNQAERKPGVLIVDGEPAVRVVLSVGLRRLGFPVWEAPSGQEAVHLYKRHQEHIQAVLLEVPLTGFDGPSTLTQLRAINDDLLCFYMTASASNDTEAPRRYNPVGIIFKPFRVSEVVQRLSKQLLPSSFS